MVYNALKLFMEINPDLFDEAMQQYKQRRAEYVEPILCKVTAPDCIFSGIKTKLFVAMRRGKSCENKPKLMLPGANCRTVTLR